MNKLKRQIKSTLKDCKAGIPSYLLSEEGGNYVNQGWIEALEYVLGRIKEVEKTKEI
tara:strand:+ start:202 stop:372 length:171 start_codon:yes stop_codon:yes gene_type:complete